MYLRDLLKLKRNLNGAVYSFKNEYWKYLLFTEEKGIFQRKKVFKVSCKSITKF